MVYLCAIKVDLKLIETNTTVCVGVFVVVDIVLVHIIVVNVIVVVLRVVPDHIMCSCGKLVFILGS